MKKVRKKMFIALSILLLIVGSVIIWFNVPYSSIKNDFNVDTNKAVSENRLSTAGEIFTEREFSHLPKAIQKYMQNCGYIGKPKMSYLKMEYQDVSFMQDEDNSALSIDYTQYNFTNEPCRLAFIDTSMYGVPFQGYDYYLNGQGGMTGVIAKTITLFDQTGSDMDKACLATFLSESLFTPSALLEDYIIFEEISDFKVQGTIAYKGNVASGIFTFNKEYEMISFTTNDRAVTNDDGTMEYVPWSALCSEYKVRDGGIKLPSHLKAVWNYPDRDFTYFDGIISNIEYGNK